MANQSNSSKQKYARHYNPSFLKYGFIATEIKGETRPQCVVCNQIMSADSMKDSKLQGHLNSKHPTLKDKPLEYFERAKAEMGTRHNLLVSFTSDLPNTFDCASLVLAESIAKQRLPHTAGENFLIPTASKMLKVIGHPAAAAALERVAHSDSTVSRRLKDLSIHVEGKLVDILKNTKFAIQLDESADFSKRNMLVCFVKAFFEDQLLEELLFFKEITDSPTGERLFQILNDYFIEKGLPWENCIAICTDGAGAMAGKYIGLQSRIQSDYPWCFWTHCVLHRENLVAKKMSSELNEDIKICASIVNHIRGSSLRTTLFRQECDSNDEDYNHLIYYTDVRWLSKGAFLNRFIELKTSIKSFLLSSESKLALHMDDKVFMTRVAYMADIFDKLNDLNISMQGRNITIIDCTEKLNAFVQKLELWSVQLRSNNLSSFPQLSGSIEQLTQESKSAVLSVAYTHLDELVKGFKEKFDLKAESFDSVQWIRNPFSYELPNPSNQQAEELIDLRCSYDAKNDHRTLDIIAFWIRRKALAPNLFAAAEKYLLPFATTYLCESAFSSMKAVKTSGRSRLDAEHDMRVNINNLAIDMAKVRINKSQ